MLDGILLVSLILVYLKPEVIEECGLAVFNVIFISVDVLVCSIMLFHLIFLKHGSDAITPR